MANMMLVDVSNGAHNKRRWVGTIPETVCDDGDRPAPSVKELETLHAHDVGTVMVSATSKATASLSSIVN
jgi:hypothetical protein